MRTKKCLAREGNFLAWTASIYPSSYFPPSAVFKKSFEKAQKKSRDLDSEDVEELAKQTLLSTEDVEMWVTHLDSVKKRRQARSQPGVSQTDRSPVIR